ncbi:MAG TPA: mannitol dehydrogenase family protein, partial [Actinopolymorphaceae bacterium]
LAGARFVTDVRPFEQRKLWLLNGAHSLLAYAGPTRGHTTVSEALADPVCSAWVERWWDEACRHLALPTEELTAYREALRDRFANPAIRHQLSQIQADGSQKLPIRVLPVIARERANGIVPYGGAVAMAGWLLHLRSGDTVSDPRAAELTDLVRPGSGSTESAVRRLLTAIAPQTGLADDAELVRAIADSSRELSG